MSGIPGFQGVAGGDINTSRFVKISTAANKTLLEAGASERCFGISQEGTALAPIPSASGLAAVAGNPIHVYIPGQFCLLKIGSGGCVAGDQLAPGTDGKGVINTTDKRWTGAIALETASEDELALVYVMAGFNAA